MGLEGIHHVTCITGDAPGNVDFYARVLGLRLVKKTVNQDDPTVYHLFYADEQGSPGADITFFEYPGARRGRAGAGMVHTVTWRVASEAGARLLGGRLAQNGVQTQRSDGRLRFDDPEGLGLELAVVSTPDEPLVAELPEMPAELALQGFHGVRAFAAEPERSRGLLEDALGFTPAGTDSWEARGERRGGLYAYDPPPASGAGVPRRRHRAPRGVVVDDGRARGVATARRSGGHAPDTGDRPVLVPLRLLPRAQRRPVRARDARAGLRGRRGPRAPRRVADPAAGIRAPPRAGRAGADPDREPSHGKARS